MKVLIINDVNLSSVVLYFLHLFNYLKLFNFYTRAIPEVLFSRVDIFSQISVAAAKHSQSET